ncbi:MAG: hypothetical protein AB1705_00175 [Verrucomicrobiota bacterium]
MPAKLSGSLRCVALIRASLVALAALPLHAGQTNDTRSAEAYRVIADRNLFGLKAAAHTNPAAAAAPAASEPGYKLAGITVVPPKKIAFVVKQERGAADQHFALSEGQKDGNLEALWIDYPGGTVLLREGRQNIVLSFDAQARERITAELAEQQFNEEHQRAHELNERLEQERVERELAETAQAKGEAKPLNH